MFLLIWLLWQILNSHFLFQVTIISSFVFPSLPPKPLNIFFAVCIMLVCGSVLVLVRLSIASLVPMNNNQIKLSSHAFPDLNKLNHIIASIFCFSLSLRYSGIGKEIWSPSFATWSTICCVPSFCCAFVPTCTFTTWDVTNRAMPYKTVSMGTVPITGMSIMWALWTPRKLTWVFESGEFIQALYAGWASLPLGVLLLD